MKKVFLALILTILPFWASSQTFIKSIKAIRHSEIPKDLCIPNHKYLFDRYDKDKAGKLRIYDETFELIKEIDPIVLFGKCPLCHAQTAQ